MPSTDAVMRARLLIVMRSGQLMPDTCTSRYEALLRKLAPTPIAWMRRPALSAASSGLRAELLMPSESSTIASTSRRGICCEATAIAWRERGRSAVGREGFQLLKIFQRPGVFGEFDDPQVEIPLELLPPFFDLPAGLIESRDAGRIVGDAHRGRTVEQENQARLVGQFLLIAINRPEDEHHDEQNRETSQQKKRLPLPAFELPERPQIKHPRQENRGGHDEKHQAEAGTLFEGEVVHEWVVASESWLVGSGQ